MPFPQRSPPFEACSCKPAPRGQPSSFVQLRTLYIKVRSWRTCRYHQLRQNFCFCKRRSTTAIQLAEHSGNRYQNGPEVGIGINVKNAFSQPYVKSPVVPFSMDIPTSPSGSQDRKVCPCIPDRSLRWVPPRNPTGCKPG